ncbi:MAG: DUF3014 domain-containing protein [Burkholderiaceae bacterium]|jgi:hypothetical protein
MKNILWWIIPAVLTVGALYWVYEYERRPLPEVTAPQATAVPPAPSAPVTPPPPSHYPVPEVAPATGTDALKDVPTLEQSDTSMRQALVGLVGQGPFDGLFWPKDIVRHLVATVDNLPRARVSQLVMPVKKAGGHFQVKNEGGTISIDPTNSARYRPYVDMLENIDSHRLVALYVHFYPLFQQAYKDLGYPTGYFNDRLVVVIDDLLAAPEPTQPPKLLEPHLMYQYADPDIEALSGGQKMMIRMGPQNEAKVKKKLQDIRAQLTNPATQPKP